MDDIPYDFIDRVFTKLNAVEHERIACESPLWTEAARVYKKKLRYLNIEISTAYSPPALTYRLSLTVYPGQRHESSGFTFDDLTRMDDRFIRIADFSVEKTFRQFLPGIDIDENAAVHKIENLSEFIGYLSHFPVDQISIYAAHQEFIDECLKSVVQTPTLEMEIFPGSEALLKKHLETESLQHLILAEDCRLPFNAIRNELQAYVLRPQFKYLECHLETLGVEFLKRLVDMWRAEETPFKAAEICIDTLRYPQAATVLRAEIASLSLASYGRNQFTETNGNRCVFISCELAYTKLEFGVISK